MAKHFHSILKRFLPILILFPFLIFPKLSFSEAQDPQPQKSPTKIMLIFDASGSMQEKMKREQKINIARQAVNDVLSKTDKQTEIGLKVYGHREKGDCNDIQTILPIGKLDPKKIQRSLAQIRPKGKTPLTQAVKDASTELDYLREKSAVILLTDGKENCSMDPCRLGKELSSVSKDFKVYVIGFNIPSTDQGGLRCLATETGGTYYTAENADQIKVALNSALDQAQYVQLKDKKLDPLFQPLRFIEKSPNAVQSGVSLSAVLQEGAMPLEKGLHWVVNDPDSHKMIDSSLRAQPVIKLKPGKYEVVVTFGDIRDTEIITVKRDAVARKIFVLNGGYLRLYATTSEGGDWLEGNVRWWVKDPTQNNNGEYQNIAESSQASPLFKLKAGKYLVLVKFGEASVTKEVEVKMGKISEDTVIITAGALQLQAVPKLGGEAITQGLQWTITEVKPGADGQYKQVGSSEEASPIFYLSSGDYRIHVQFGKASASTDVHVNHSKNIKSILNLEAGVIQLTAQQNEMGAPIENVSWEIQKPDPKATEKYVTIAQYTETQPILRLPAGEYRVIVSYNGTRSGSIIHVDAGDEKNVVVLLEG